MKISTHSHTEYGKDKFSSKFISKMTCQSKTKRLLKIEDKYNDLHVNTIFSLQKCLTNTKLKTFENPKLLTIVQPCETKEWIE